MDLAPGHILILSGSPGSGKTTTAGRLAHLPGAPKVHVHSDDFWGNIKHGHIAPWLPEADQQNHMVMEIAADVAGRYARNGYFVVLDGVVRPWWLPAFRALGQPLHYVILRPKLDEAITRCQARGGDSLSDPVVVADLYAEFADLGAYEVNVLRSTGLDPAETLEAVRSAVVSGKYRLDVA